MTTLKPRPVFHRASGKTRPARAGGPVTPNRSKGGFSLLELSIVITIIAIVTGISVDMGMNMIESVDIVANNHKLNVIEQALMAYRLANERLPCPADASLAATSAYYGYEAGTLSGSQWAPDMGVCTTSGTYTTTTTGGYTSGVLTGTAASSVAANYNVLIPKGANATNIAFNTYVVEGAVPFKALGLPESFMYDSWGRKFAYAVWAPDTAEGAFLNYGISPSCGAITVNDPSGNHRSQSSIYALVSFGPDGHGGYAKSGTRYFSGSDNGNGGASPQPPAIASEWQNCHCTATGDAANYTATYVQKEWTEDPNDRKDIFDDTVRFKERWQMIDQRDLFQTTGLPCTPGFRIDGINAGDNTGWTLATGDVNGDGIPDLIIGMNNNHLSGTVYVVFGTKSGFPDPLPLSSLNGTNGFSIAGESNDWMGTSIAVADINDDGYADIIMSTANYHNNPSCARVVLGGPMRADGTWLGTGVSTVSTYNLNGSTGVNGTNGFAITCNAVAMASPAQVSAGDVNGDKVPDILIGDQSVPGGWVIFGGKGAWPASFDVSGLGGSGQPNGTNGFAITGTGDASLGAQVMIGDLNGDGYGDMVLFANSLGGHLGKVDIVFGHANPWVASINATTLAASPTGFTATIAGDGSGAETTFANGDINGDGVNDFIFGSGSSLNAFGQVEVLFGQSISSSAWPYSSIDLTTALNGNNGFVVNGASWGDYLTSATAGDVNCNGVADLIMGAWGGSKAYALFGHTSTSSPWTSPTGLPSNGTAGSELDGAAGGDKVGYSVAVGDINGDGCPDVIIGAPAFNSGVGSVYIYYGKKAGWPSTYNLGNL